MCLWGNNAFAWLIGERAHGSATFTNLTGEKNDEMDSWAKQGMARAFRTRNGC